MLRHKYSGEQNMVDAIPAMFETLSLIHSKRAVFFHGHWIMPITHRCIILKLCASDLMTFGILKVPITQQMLKKDSFPPFFLSFPFFPSTDEEGWGKRKN